MVVDSNTVFLVDDDTAVRVTLGRALSKRGFRVEIFDSATSFLNYYTEPHPGCLILDLSMPVINGLQLQSKLLKLGFTIPIIFITGHGVNPQTEQALKAGALDFFEKPLKLNILSERIQHAFEIDAEKRLKVTTTE